MSCAHGLTVEQKKKIEENRLKALALRAQKSKSFPVHFQSHIPQSETSIAQIYNRTSNTTAPTCTQNFHNGKQSVLHNHSQPSNSNSLSHQKIFISQNNSSAGVSTSQRTSIPVISQKSAVGLNSYGSQKKSIEVPKNKFYGLPDKVINGRCVLMSIDRFCVNVDYHGPLVDFFKQRETRHYDTTSRTWSFNLIEYEKFINDVKNSQPEIVIEPLPPIVVQTFCKEVSDNSIPEADLSTVDDKLVATLMPFQREGVNFALHHGGRILLADAMGLGKTLQALCIARFYRPEWPLLVISPSSVRYDWAQQIYKWLPSIDPQDVNVVDSGKGSVMEGLVTIISYDLIPKKLFEIKERKFKVIIMDESHFLKNAKAQRTKAAALISRRAKRIILLSGTPALSRPSELFTQITAVCPGYFNFHDFGLRYCAAKQQPWGWDYSGASNLGELQLLLERKIMIRRQKSDVLQQLPDKTRQVVILNPVLVASSKGLTQACKAMGRSSLKGMEKRGALLQYFHETSKAKMKAVKDFVMDLVECDKKFLVFAHHQEMLDCIETTLVEHTNVQYIRIDGRTRSELRSQLCRKFQSQESCKVAVLSIMAANAGLNLSEANVVVFAELFWNPGILVQAEDRVHRIGQKNACLIQYLVARKTADDYIWPLVQDKLNVLTKAGLSKDCFADADTMHVQDKTQKNILEMFKTDFIDESPVVASESDQPELDSNSSVSSGRKMTTPVKRKRNNISPSSSPSSPGGSAQKRQLRITHFLQSPEKQKCIRGALFDGQENKSDGITTVISIDNPACESNTAENITCSFGDERSDLLSQDDKDILENSNWDDDFWD